MQNYVAYFRVSTDKQGVMGLGMDAQREAVSRYVHSRGHIAAEYVEVESGRKVDRPQLQEALTACRTFKAVLLIARLDRLARNVAFIANLMNSDVEFVAVDMPTANRLTIHILAAVAEHEREMISQRTRAALAAARARGTKLGNPRYKEALEKARAALVYRRPPDEVLHLMTQWRVEGMVLTDIAERLNKLRIATPRGFHWYASTVRAALSRLPDFQKDRYPETPIALNPAFVISCAPVVSSLNRYSSGGRPSVAPRDAGRRDTTDGDVTMAELAEAYRMIDAFASVGATHFDVTFTGIDGEKRGFRAQQTARQLRTSMPQLLPGLTERQQNLIVRPHGAKVDFIQLDDLNADQIKSVSSVSCLVLETSPGNHQAWVAVSDLADLRQAKEFSRRLRKGTAADPNASGATRVAGTENYKRQYGPAFPTVKILQAAPGRVTTKAQLEALGIVAAPESAYVAAATPFRGSSEGNWPDYKRCVAGAPMKHGENTPDISRADFFWSLMAAQRHKDVGEIASRLMELSAKAQENAERYARLTAEKAVEAAGRQRRSRA